MKKSYLRILFSILIVFCLTFLVYKNFFKNEEVKILEPSSIDEEISNSNIIKDVKYTSVDVKGNKYEITASKGEIDFSNTNIIFLTDVNAMIILTDLNTIKITSSFGKYNTENLDTIFSKNVIIKYLDNKITGEYLDFSPERNSMIISKNVIYNNPKNILKTDVVEINLKTKDTKIYMYEEKKKVKIKSNN